MPRPRSDGPTERELEILQALWQLGPSSVRDVRNALNQGRSGEIAYNSVLTIMSIMQSKDLLTRDESSRTHIYHPVASRDETEGRLVQRLIDEVFGGSAMRLVSRAISVQATSDADLAKIERLLGAFDDAPE